MRKRLLFLVLFAASVVGLRAATPFPAMLDAYYEKYLALFPIDAAVYGDSDTRYEAVWPIEISAEHRAKVMLRAPSIWGRLPATIGRV